MDFDLNLEKKCFLWPWTQFDLSIFGILFIQPRLTLACFQFVILTALQSGRLTDISSLNSLQKLDLIQSSIRIWHSIEFAFIVTFDSVF